jgi:hypothetical protein
MVRQDGGSQRRTEHRRENYKQYNLILERETLLSAMLERYKELYPLTKKGRTTGERSGGLSEFIRECLCEYLGIGDKDIYREAGISYRFKAEGEEIRASHDLDELIERAVATRKDRQLQVEVEEERRGVAEG